MKIFFLWLLRAALSLNVVSLAMFIYINDGMPIMYMNLAGCVFFGILIMMTADP